jgi:hypothetical protein
MSQNFSPLQSGVTVFGDLYGIINNNIDAIRSQWSGTSAPGSPAIGQPFYNITNNTVTIWNGSTWQDLAEASITVLTLMNEIVTARGVTDSLNDRLSVSINDDGTLKGDAPVGTWWMTEPDAVSYSDSSTFTVSGNKTALYVPDRAVHLYQTSDAFGYIASSTYDGGSDVTTVTLTQSVIDSGLIGVEYGQPPLNAPASLKESDIGTKILAPDGDGSGLSGFGTVATRDVGTAPGNVPVLDAEGKLAESVLPSSGVPSGLIMLSSDGSVPPGWEQVENPLGGELPGRVVSPIMTGPTTGDWTATESHTPTGGAFWTVFDGTLGTLHNSWYTKLTSGFYGTLECVNEFTFNMYTIAAPSNYLDHTIKSWRLQYWDGSSWQTAHTVTGETNWSESEVRKFNLPENVTTTKIRLYVDDSNLSGNSGVAEVGLIIAPIWVRKL